MVLFTVAVPIAGFWYTNNDMLKAEDLIKLD